MSFFGKTLSCLLIGAFCVNAFAADAGANPLLETAVKRAFAKQLARAARELNGQIENKANENGEASLSALARSSCRIKTKKLSAYIACGGKEATAAFDPVNKKVSIGRKEYSFELARKREALLRAIKADFTVAKTGFWEKTYGLFLIPQARAVVLIGAGLAALAGTAVYYLTDKIHADGCKESGKNVLAELKQIQYQCKLDLNELQASSVQKGDTTTFRDFGQMKRHLRPQGKKQSCGEVLDFYIDSFSSCHRHEDFKGTSDSFCAAFKDTAACLSSFESFRSEAVNGGEAAKEVGDSQESLRPDSGEARNH